MFKSLSLAACLVLAASPALAADDSKKETDDNKMVCKRVAGTGWRLSKQRECKKKIEWDAESRAQRDEMNRNDRGRTFSGSGSN